MENGIYNGTKYIGIVTDSQHVFEAWINKNGKHDEQYSIINNENPYTDDDIDIKLYRIVKLKGHENVKKSIIQHAQQHVFIERPIEGSRL